MLIMPIASRGTPKEGEHTGVINILYLDLSTNGTIERKKQISTPEGLSNGLPKGNVVGDHTAQLHSNPPKLNSATSRKPMRSTFA